MGVVFNIQKFSLHDGPGIRTVVFLKGCPLRCRWCANPESQRQEPQTLGGDQPEVKGQDMPVGEVLRVCLQDRAFYEESGGGVTLSGGEPLMQAGFAKELLQALGEEGIHRAIETTGCVEENTFTGLLPYAELLLFDVKHWDSQKHRQGTGAENGLILKNLEAAVKAGKDILPRIPVIPGFNSALEDAAELARLLKSMGLVKAQLLPFHQFGENKYEKLGMPYAYADVPALHPEDLKEYQRAFIQRGVEAFF